MVPIGLYDRSQLVFASTSYLVPMGLLDRNRVPIGRTLAKVARVALELVPMGLRKIVSIFGLVPI